MSNIVIYHNPQCATSRNTLAIIRNAGVEPEVIEYLKSPPTKEKLVELINAMGMIAREVIRQKGDLYDELNLADTKWANEELIDFMIEHPSLINRPIVITEKGVKLCRPSELVLDMLSTVQQGKLSKEDGELVIDKDGQRVKKK
jgi:arsenate reductase